MLAHGDCRNGCSGGEVERSIKLYDRQPFHQQPDLGADCAKRPLEGQCLEAEIEQSSCSFSGATSEGIVGDSLTLLPVVQGNPRVV